MRYTSQPYKHQLDHDEVFQTAFRPKVAIHTRYISMTTGGLMTIRMGYAWDGASGPVFDTKKNHHAGLCHDAIYQLMRMGMLDMEMWRDADKEFTKLCSIYGTGRIVVAMYSAGLRLANGKYANPKERKKVLYLPSIHM
jgi:hypothetical protein